MCSSKFLGKNLGRNRIKYLGKNYTKHHPNHFRNASYRTERNDIAFEAVKSRAEPRGVYDYIDTACNKFVARKDRVLRNGTICPFPVKVHYNYRPCKSCYASSTGFAYSVEGPCARFGKKECCKCAAKYCRPDERPYDPQGEDGFDGAGKSRDKPSALKKYTDFSDTIPLMAIAIIN